MEKDNGTYLCSGMCCTTLAGCGSSTQAEKPSEKQRLRGRAALQRDRQRLHLPYGIMRQPTTGKNW